MLDTAGPSAHDAAMLWWLMFGLFSVVMSGVIALWLVALKRKPADITPEEEKKRHSRWIVWGGLALPSAAIVLILSVGIPAGHRMLPLPSSDADIFRIEVTGHQWWWEVHYPDTGIQLQNEIHMPAGVPVDLHLRSNDVIHSFWVPRLGGKLDMIPGRTNVLRLEADEPGIYRGQCAEFCGLNHAFMQFTLEAHAPDDFQTWYEEAQRNAQ